MGSLCKQPAHRQFVTSVTDSRPLEHYHRMIRPFGIRYLLSGAMMLGNIFSFHGRRGRLSYFMTWLLLIVIGGIVGGLFCSTGSESGIIFALLIATLGLWPGFAIGAQRFHDFGASGWWNLLSIVPFVGFIIFLILLFAPGDKQANRYGAVPTTGYAPTVLAPQ